MKYNRESRNKPLHLWSVDFSIRVPIKFNEENTVFLNKWLWDSRFSSVQFSCSAMSAFLQPYGLKHTRIPCPPPAPGACSNSCPSSWWWQPTISFSAVPFSSGLQSFPASGSFPVSWFFISGGQNIGSFFISHLLVSNQEYITDLKQCFSLKLIILLVLK